MKHRYLASACGVVVCIPACVLLGGKLFWGLVLLHYGLMLMDLYE